MLGAGTRQVEVSGKTLRDLIETLNDTAGGKLKREVVTEKGDLDPRFKIYVNGFSCDDLGLDTSIREGDSIMLFSIIDGG